MAFRSIGVWSGSLFAVLLTGLSAVSAQTLPIVELDAAHKQLEQLRRAGKSAEGRPIAVDALALAERNYGLDHVEVARALKNLAGFEQKLENSADAEKLYLRELAIRVANPGPNNRDLASVLNSLGWVLDTQGRVPEAETFLKRALSVRKAALGNSHADVAQSMHNLGALFLRRKRFDEAAALLERAAEIAEKSKGGMHPHVANSLELLAMAQSGLKRTRAAERNLTRALRIREAGQDGGHPDLAILYSRLAGLKQDQKKRDEAGKFFEKALQIAEGRLGKGHTTTAKIAANYAQFQKAEGRLSKAVALLTDSVSSIAQVRGQNHTDYADTVGVLASALALQGKSEEAGRLFEQSFAIHGKLQGLEASDTVFAAKGLADYYRATGQPTKANEVESLVAGAPVPGARHVQVIFATNRAAEEPDATTGLQSYGTKSANKLNFARAVVQMTADGGAGLARRRASGFGELDRGTGSLVNAEGLKIKRLDTLATTDEFLASARKNLTVATTYQKQALVFVHGYNVTPGDAIKRAAQIAIDLEFDGLVVPFSWPSAGTIFGYSADTDSSDAAVSYAVELLDTLRTGLPDVTVHLIAHSMGNVVLLKALEQIAARDRSTPAPLFGQLISAHADVDAARCAQLTMAARRVVNGITFYVNESDWALWASRKIRGGGRRCGDKAVVFDGADTIDTTGMGRRFEFGLGALRHDVFVRDPLLFGELNRLLLTGTRPPEQRTVELRPVKNPSGQTYWRYDRTLNATIAK